jgi:hypothetical protein
MRTRILLSVLIGLGMVVALAAGSWYLLHHRGEKVCPFSGRPIHSQTRAFVTVGGKKYETCCVRCAIIEAQQTGKRLRVLEVADFENGKLMDPEKAWFVEGSSVNFCTRMAPAETGSARGTVYLRAFDRCSPSILAFRTEKRARAFIGQHGGVLKRLDDLLKEATTATGKVHRP